MNLMLITLTIFAALKKLTILVSAFYQAQRKLNMLLATSQPEMIHPQEEINQ